MKKFLQEFGQRHEFCSMSIIFVLIALAFTFPLVSRISSEIPKGGGDVYQVISTIDNEVGQMASLTFKSKMVFVAKHFNTFIPYVLLNPFFGKIATYNILFLLTYVLSGLGMFLLAKKLTKNVWAAFIAGLIFAFAPFHYYQSVAVHLGTMQQQWLPFFVLLLILFFEKFEFKYFLGTGFFALLIAMSEHQMLAFTAIFVGIFAAYEIYKNKNILRNKKFWAYVVCSLGFLAIVAFGMFGEMLKVATSDNNFLNAGVNAANKYAIKMLDPVMPTVFQPLWGGASVSLQELVWGDANRGSYFLGFSVLAMLVWFGYRLKKRKVVEMKDGQYRKDIFFWSIAAGAFYVFSLGVSFAIGKINIYLPYYLIYRFVPFYENIRTTGRLFLFVELAVAILAAYSFTQFLKKYPGKEFRYVLGLSFLILLEFWVAPLVTMPINHSALYDVIAKDKQSYKLIEIPGSTDYEFASYAMFTQSVHGKEMLNGMPLARKISGQFAMQKNTPVIKALLYTIPKGNDPEKKVDNPQQYFANANEVLKQQNVGYITISKKYASEKIIKGEEKFIEKYIKYDNKYEDEFLIAYKISQ